MYKSSFDTYFPAVFRLERCRNITERGLAKAREWPGSWLRSQQLTIFNGDWMSASLSANRRVMLTSGQTDNGRALNAHGARSIPWIRGGVYWGFHPAITVNDGTYETLFSRRVCSLHTSCKYSVTPAGMVNGADVRVTPVCKPSTKTDSDATRLQSEINAEIPRHLFFKTLSNVDVSSQSQTVKL